MKTKLSLLVVVLAFVFGLLSNVRAEVQLVTFKLTKGGTESYEVPPDKIFIFEWSAPEFNVLPANVQAELPVGIIGVAVSRKFVGGTTFRVTAISSEGSTIIMTGLLIDSEDLYAAAVPSQFGQPIVASGEMSVVLEQSSPRPSEVKVESSTDLENWSPDPTATVKNTADKTESEVTVAIDEQKKFVRATVIARPTE